MNPRPTNIHQLISLDGKQALITGSGAGIGRATAYRFAEAGAHLHLVDIDEEALQKVQEEIRTLYGASTTTHVVDLSSKAAIDDLWGLICAGVAFKQRLPLGRLGQPDEVARMVLVLASDLASYVHGAAIPVDGGFLVA